MGVSMNDRLLGHVLAIVVLLILTPALGAGQARTTAQNSSSLPRTSWGAPNLQGVWWGSTITPLERPEGVTNEFLTDEQEAELVQRNADSGLEWDAGTDLARAYDVHWFDRPTSVASNRRTSLIVDPPDGRLPALAPDTQQWLDSPEGRQFIALREAHADGTVIAEGPEEMALWDRCVTRGLVLRSGGYNNYYQLVQTQDYVAIHQEMIHETRIIPLDGRPHLPGHVRQWLGDGRGHWEGETLVVETTNVSPSQAIGFFPQALRPHQFASVPLPAGNLRLIERFTRVDADTLDYEFTIEDPTTFASPWTARLPMSLTDKQLYEYACHEGNKGMYGILAGSRATEKKASNAAAR